MSRLTLIWTFLLTRFRVSLLITILFLGWGFFAYNAIPKENEPDVEIPTGVIQTIFPGASPQDTEKLVTEKIEQEIKSIENLKKYTSTSLAGSSVVFVEFESGTDMTKNFQNVREALDDAEKKLPDGILDDPDLQEIKMSDTPILTLALSGDLSMSQLKTIAEDMQDEIEGVQGVKEARIVGIPEDKFHIFIDPQKLEQFGLSLEEIAQKIKANHLNIPMGKIFVKGEKFDLRVEAEFETAKDFLNFPIFEKNGQMVLLSDFATVRREFDEMEVENQFSAGHSAKRSISIDVIKTVQKANIFKIIDGVFDKIDEMKEAQIIPSNVEISIIFNGSEDIAESLSRLLSSGTQTLILIGFTLFLALGWRASALSFFAIPLSMLISIGVLYILGETFNFLSLFALVLAIGLLVDNAIIMTEGISDNIFEKKLSPFQAATQAIETFRWPIITGTFTTIFAFLPMIFVISGVSGDYISIIPKTITVVLISSLFVALFLLPVFAEKFFALFKPKKIPTPKFLPAWKAWYERTMLSLLTPSPLPNNKNKKRSKVGFILFIATCIFIFSVSLFPLKQIFIEIFPTSDENYFTFSLELPKGSKLSETKKIIPLTEKVLLPHFKAKENGDVWLKNFSFSVGQKSSFDPVNQQNGGILFAESNILGITVNLIDKNDRETPSYTIAKQLKQELIAALPDFVEVNLSERQSGPPTGESPVSVRLIGEEMDHLEILSEQLKEAFENIELKNGAKLKNITDNLGDRLPQLTYTFDRQKMEVFGIAPSQLFQTLRASVEGATIFSISENDEEIDVDVRFDFVGNKTWTDPKSLEILAQIPIKTKAGKFIKLSDIATFEISSEISTIRHRDGKRIVTIGASVDGKATPTEFTPEIMKALDSLEKHAGEQFQIGGDNEETNRLVGEMATAMVLGVFLILIILVLQFDSFLQSFVIVLLLPFSLTGVFIGFWLSGTPISFPAMIGIVALAGIIVNDAIVLIDRINQNLRSGMEKIPALIDAGKSRMQPILITSITTIFGLLPLALSDPIWEGLGFAIIYGMTLSTVLTLLLVPCLILFLEFWWKQTKKGAAFIFRFQR